MRRKISADIQTNRIRGIFSSASITTLAIAMWGVQTAYAVPLGYDLLTIEKSTSQLIAFSPISPNGGFSRGVIGPVDFSRVEALTFSSADNTLYGADNETGNLVKLPRSPSGDWGKWEVVGPIGSRVTDMTVGPDGTLYGISPGSTSNILKINTGSGRGTVSTNIGGIFGASYTTISYQPNTDQFIATAKFIFDGRGDMIAFDPETGEKTRLAGAPRSSDAVGDPTSDSLIMHLQGFGSSSSLVEVPTDGSNGEFYLRASPLEGLAIVPNNPLTDLGLLADPTISFSFLDTKESIEKYFDLIGLSPLFVESSFSNVSDDAGDQGPNININLFSGGVGELAEKADNLIVTRQQLIEAFLECETTAECDLIQEKLRNWNNDFVNAGREAVLEEMIDQYFIGPTINLLGQGVETAFGLFEPIDPSVVGSGSEALKAVSDLTFTLLSGAGAGAESEDLSSFLDSLFIEEVGVTGTVNSFSVNPDFYHVDLDVTARITPGLISAQFIDQRLGTFTSILDNPYALGTGTITDLTRGAEYDTIRLSISQIEASAVPRGLLQVVSVPEPTSLSIFGTGLVAIGFFWRRRWTTESSRHQTATEKATALSKH